MIIPEDPFMLLSFINMKLRDGDYEDLDDLCHALDCDKKELINKLQTAGFEYIPDLKQFK